MINFSDYMKKTCVNWIHIFLLFFGGVIGFGVIAIGSHNGMIFFVIYVIAIYVYMYMDRRKKYKELIDNGCILYGIVVLSKKNLLSYRGVINNIIKVQINNKGITYCLKSEYKMQKSVYKRYPNIIGKKVRVLIDPDNVKNHYIFHEDLFGNEGFKL